jgi:hypothetical protein
MNAHVGKGLSVAKDAWALLSALGIATYFGVSWIANTNQVVNVTFPAHVTKETRKVQSVEETLAKLTDLQAAQEEQRAIEQIGFEMKCEEPDTDLPSDYCADVLKAKRIRERSERMGRRAQP